MTTEMANGAAELSPKSVGGMSRSKGRRSGVDKVTFYAKDFVRHREVEFNDHYELGEMLGEGAWGQVFICHDRITKAERAVKIIEKANMNPSEYDLVTNEFNILKDLDHPNILKMYELTEDDKTFCIVTDIIKGGELYDQLESLGKLSEDEVALIMYTVLSCVNYYHKNGIVHRDLNIENIMMEENKALDQLKVIDFGLATKWEEGVKLSAPVGTVYYVAPEVLEQEYGPECDIWSCGVIAYTLLAGYTPFEGNNDMEIREQIMIGKVYFDGAVWENISDEAKDFVTQLLTYEPEKRPTPAQCVRHPWIEKARLAQLERFNKDLAKAALMHMKSFSTAPKLKQVACSLIASQLLINQDRTAVNEVFHALDINCDGTLEYDEMREHYRKFLDEEISDEELENIFHSIGKIDSDHIEYSGFVVAAIDPNELLAPEKLEASFTMLDAQGKGYISEESIRSISAHHEHIQDDAITGIVKSMDTSGYGKITFAQYRQSMCHSKNQSQNDVSLDDMLSLHEVNPMHPNANNLAHSSLTSSLGSSSHNSQGSRALRSQNFSASLLDEKPNSPMDYSRARAGSGYMDSPESGSSDEEDDVFLPQTKRSSALSPSEIAEISAKFNYIDSDCSVSSSDSSDDDSEYDLYKTKLTSVPKDDKKTSDHVVSNEGVKPAEDSPEEEVVEETTPDQEAMTEEVVEKLAAGVEETTSTPVAEEESSPTGEIVDDEVSETDAGVDPAVDDEVVAADEDNRDIDLENTVPIPVEDEESGMTEEAETLIEDVATEEEAAEETTVEERAAAADVSGPVVDDVVQEEPLETQDNSVETPQEVGGTDEGVVLEESSPVVDDGVQEEPLETAQDNSVEAAQEVGETDRVVVVDESSPVVDDVVQEEPLETTQDISMEAAEEVGDTDEGVVVDESSPVVDDGVQEEPLETTKDNSVEAAQEVGGTDEGVRVDDEPIEEAVTSELSSVLPSSQQPRELLIPDEQILDDDDGVAFVNSDSMTCTSILDGFRVGILHLFGFLSAKANSSSSPTV